MGRSSRWARTTFPSRCTTLPGGCCLGGKRERGAVGDHHPPSDVEGYNFTSMGIHTFSRDGSSCWFVDLDFSFLPPSGGPSALLQSYPNVSQYSYLADVGCNYYRYPLPPHFSDRLRPPLPPFPLHSLLVRANVESRHILTDVLTDVPIQLQFRRTLQHALGHRSTQYASPSSMPRAYPSPARSS